MNDLTNMIYEVRDITRSPDEWRKLTQKHGSRIFSLYETLKFNVFGKDKLFGTVINIEGKITLLPLIFRVRDEIVLESLMFPVLAPSHQRIVLDVITDIAEKYGAEKIILGSFTQGVETLDPQLASSMVARDRCEFVFDLSMPYEEILQGIHSNHRRKIRKNKNSGHRMEKLDKDQIRHLMSCETDWKRKKGISAGYYSLFRQFMKHRSYKRELLDKGAANLFGVKSVDDTVLSIALMLEDGEEAFYMIGASTDRGYKSGASVYLFSELVLYYQQQSFTRLNLGGVPMDALQSDHEEHGVYRFKHAFGLQPQVRKSGILKLNSKSRGRGQYES